MLFRLHDKRFSLDSGTLESFELTEQQYQDARRGHEVNGAARRSPGGFPGLALSSQAEQAINQASVIAGHYATGKVGSYVIYLTTSCNLRCSYCWNQHGLVYGDGEISLTNAQAQDVLDFILAHEPERLRITFMGGEPFLAFRQLQFFVTELRARYGSKASFLVNTNGTVLSTKRLSFLIENDVETFVSLDGPAVYHNRHRVFANGRPSFEKVLRNLWLAHRAGLKLNVGVTVSREAAANLEAVLDFILEDLPPANVTINPVMRALPAEGGHALADQELSVDEYCTYVDNYLAYTCEHFYQHGRHPPYTDGYIRDLMGALYNCTPRPFCCPLFDTGSLTITASGRLFPCHQFVADDHCIGDIHQGFRPSRLPFYAAPDRVQGCQACDVRLLCGGGGCLANNYTENGQLTLPDLSFCRRLRYTAQACLYTLSRIPDDVRSDLFAAPPSTTAR